MEERKQTPSDGWVASIWLEQEGEKERVRKKQSLKEILCMAENKAQKLGDPGE